MTDPVIQPFEGARHYPGAQALGELLPERTLRAPDALALQMADGEAWSWARLAAETGAIQAGLAGRGLVAGDHVALMCDNSLRMVATLCAIVGAGMVAIPINTALVDRGLAFVLGHCDTQLLIADPPYLERCLALGAIEAGRCISTEEGGLDWPTAFGQAGELVARGCGLDPALIIYTSGTTGDAKGAAISHATALAGAAGAAGVMLEADAQSVIYTSLPLFHCAAQQMGLWAALLSGAQLVLAARFSATSFWEHVRRYRVTAFLFVGPMTSILWKAPPSPQDRRHTVRLAVGGGPRLAWSEFEERFNLKFVECYGMTETFGGCVTHRPGRGREGSVGKALAHVEVDVLDEQGLRAAVGTAGQIVLRPRSSDALFSGYYKRPDLTAAAMKQGCFQTGDLGVLDADGYLFYQSRARDIIRRRGENISALAVEAAAVGCPGIADCGVVGVPSELGEEDLLAVLVADGTAPPMQVLVEQLRQRLPAFAVPRYLCFADSLPKTVTGRLQRHLLRPLATMAFDREKSR